MHHHLHHLYTLLLVCYNLFSVALNAIHMAGLDFQGGEMKECTMVEPGK